VVDELDREGSERAPPGGDHLLVVADAGLVRRPVNLRGKLIQLNLGLRFHFGFGPSLRSLDPRFAGFFERPEVARAGRGFRVPRGSSPTHPPYELAEFGDSEEPGLRQHWSDASMRRWCLRRVSGPRNLDRHRELQCSGITESAAAREALPRTHSLLSI
jgi:hypothetical protein